MRWRPGEVEFIKWSHQARPQPTARGGGRPRRKRVQKTRRDLDESLLYLCKNLTKREPINSSARQAKPINSSASQLIRARINSTGTYYSLDSLHVYVCGVLVCVVLARVVLVCVDYSGVCVARVCVDCSGVCVARCVFFLFLLPDTRGLVYT